MGYAESILQRLIDKGEELLTVRALYGLTLQNRVHEEGSRYIQTPTPNQLVALCENV